jgi:hypothetical protein
MTNYPLDIEFRRCQKCGQVEKEETGEIIVVGKHPDDCDNIAENWVRFRAPRLAVRFVGGFGKRRNVSRQRASGKMKGPRLSRGPSSSLLLLAF